MSLKYVLLKKMAIESGYTEKALRRKIEDGVFVQGVHYVKSPDGRIHMDVERFEEWVAGKI